MNFKTSKKVRVIFMERNSDKQQFKVICNEPAGGEEIKIVNDVYYHHNGLPSYDDVKKQWVKGSGAWSPIIDLRTTEEVRNFIFEIKIEGGKIWYETWEETMK